MHRPNWAHQHHSAVICGPELNLFVLVSKACLILAPNQKETEESYKQQQQALFAWP